MGTYADLKARIKDELGRTTDPDIDPQIALSIQDAINFYSNRRFWFLEDEKDTPTVAGQPNYNLPTTDSGDIFRQMTLVTLTTTTGRYPLQRQSWDWYRERANTTTTFGVPTAYVVHQQDVWLYPTPADAYTITYSYVRSLPALDGDNDTSVWTTDAEPLIRARAKIDLFRNVIREADPTEILNLQDEERRWLGVLSARTAEHATTGRVRPSSW